MFKKVDDFIGDDNINWSEHAVIEARKGIPLKNDLSAFDYFERYLMDLPARAVCLDLGCNIGRWKPLFDARELNYLGIDASETALKIARGFYNQSCFIRADLTEFKNILNTIGIIKVDMVFTNTVLQHMHHATKRKVLENVNGILRGAGWGLLVIQEKSDPTERTFSREGWIEFVEKCGFKYIDGTLPGDPRNGYVFRHY